MKARPRARPTEYRGILFDSKCEAMFARFLDLEALEEPLASLYPSNVVVPRASGFIYKPQGFTVNDWPPDFLVWSTVIVMSLPQLPVTRSTIVEYKPSRPTQAYLDAFLRNAQALLQMFGPKLDFELYYGSVFNDERGLYEFNNNELLHSGYDWLSGYEEEIRETRFDLVNA